MYGLLVTMQPTTMTDEARDLHAYPTTTTAREGTYPEVPSGLLNSSK